MKAPETI